MLEVHGSYIDSLRDKINNWLASDIGKSSKWAKYIRYTPDLFHLLIKLSVDPSVCNDCKAKLASTISYFVSPFDFIPEEYWGALGYVDDIALAAYVLDRIMQDTDIKTIENHWQGDTDLRPLISEILAAAEEMVGEKWWKKLKDLVKD